MLKPTARTCGCLRSAPAGGGSGWRPVPPGETVPDVHPSAIDDPTQRLTLKQAGRRDDSASSQLESAILARVHWAASTPQAARTGRIAMRSLLR
jgi:hypothetical protein